MMLGFFKKKDLGGRETRGVGYWQPGWQKELAKQLEVVVFCRMQVRLGAVEVLSVQESWLKDDSGTKRVGEAVTISCLRKDEGVDGLLEVATGEHTKYLKPAVFTTKAERYNPVLNPWSTDEELCERWGVPLERRALVAKLLADGVDEYLQQYEKQKQSPLSLKRVAKQVGCSVDELKKLAHDDQPDARQT